MTFFTWKLVFTALCKYLYSYFNSVKAIFHEG